MYKRQHLTTYRWKFRANRWHDAADVVTGLVEREIAGRDTRITVSYTHLDVYKRQVLCGILLYVMDKNSVFHLKRGRGEK